MANYQDADNLLSFFNYFSFWHFFVTCCICVCIFIDIIESSTVVSSYAVNQSTLLQPEFGTIAT